MNRFYLICILCVFCFSCSYYDYDKNDIILEKHPHSTSLFVATDRHEAGSGNNLTALLQIAASNFREMPPSLIFLGGDYVGSGPDKGEIGQPMFSTSDITDEIATALGEDADYQVLLTYGSHDKGAIEGYSGFFSGPRACEGYYVYGISYAQMIYPTDSATLAIDTVTNMSPMVTDSLILDTLSIDSLTIDSLAYDSIPQDSIPQVEYKIYDGLDLSDPFGISATSATQHFLTWINSLSDHSPIIIMTHVPMHAHRKDNMGSYTWYKAITQATRSHDIIVLYGHNHTLEERGDSLDRYNYLLNIGDSITLQEADGNTHREKLRFTYANAGYLKLGCASLLTLTDIDGNGNFEQLTIRRYHLQGEDLKYFGFTDKKNPYTIPLTKN